ncbi:MAG: sensor histidine kinase, partial [Planctomycetota bacterium]
ELTTDLLPGATLEPVPETALADDMTGLVLATVPVALVPPPLAATGTDPWSPGRMAVLITWIAVLASLLAGALTLRTAIETAEKRRRFTSAVTHELRTPLTTFRMYTEMLAEDMVDEAKRREYLRTLQDESARLGALVENVLTYARLEEGRAPARRQPVPFGELMDRLRPTLERRVADADGILAVETKGDADAVLRVDSDAVSQILFNLVDNACKYGREGGAAAVTLSADAGSGTLRFRVADRGPGVPSKHRSGVFKPFDRGDRGAGDAVQGVGLGLALARGLARELGGDLRLEDSPAGATFVLELPAV